MKISYLLIYLGFIIMMCSCSDDKKIVNKEKPSKVRVILDTDANNELDDQHAIAYMLFSGNEFTVEGITVNRTINGGILEEHYKEAERVVKLCGLNGKIKIYNGADKSFAEIKNNLGNSNYDGKEAVEFLIGRANKKSDNKLVLLPVGKLTNIALALYKDPSLAQKVRVVWLGSNYPELGEYNQENDLSALEYMLDLDLEFEIVTVRYGAISGTAEVYSTLEEIREQMRGKGPRISDQVIGRHGDAFSCFGDYSVDLFENAKMYGDPPHRSLFDMAAVAIVKNPEWAQAREIPAPALQDGIWIERPNNLNKIIIWENFDKVKIMQDFYNTIENYILVK